MPMNYLRFQSLADRLIKNFGGGGDNALLRRGSTDRKCSVVILEFRNEERDGSLIQFGDKNVYVSAQGLKIPPDNELDTIVLGGVEHKIAMPPTPLAPDGETVVFWQIVARL